MSNDNTTEELDFFDLIENAPENLQGVARLASWATNYDTKTGTPFGVFLDLIGYSEDEFGENLISKPQRVLDFVGIDHLADALKEFADRPDDVRDFVQKLISAEK
jgi:hypothetical protein